METREENHVRWQRQTRYARGKGRPGRGCACKAGKGIDGVGGQRERHAAG